MGIFSKLFGEKEAVFIEGDGYFEQEIVGESHYQKQLKKVCGGYKKDGNEVKVLVKLYYEDNNPHDNKAIRATIGGKTVGYLDRDDARLFRRKLKKAKQEGTIISCNGMIVGGWKKGLFKKGFFGVRLDLPIDKL